MCGRDRNNLLFPFDNGSAFDGYVQVQEIRSEVFEKDKLFISILPMDFSSDVSLENQNKIKVSWLNILPALDNVTHLYLRHKVNQPFFEAICNMNNLEELTFRTATVENITSIAKLTKLRRLNLDSFSRLNDISPLLKLSNLEILSISNSFKINNYEIIGGLTNLIALGLKGDEIAPKKLKLESLKPFKELKKLKHLDLCSTNVMDKSYDILFSMSELVRFDITTLIDKELREKIKTHPKLTSGFFVDFDWDKKTFYPGKEW